jgi:alpha-beta hydrolase superfamily lysophospholipase
LRDATFTLNEPGQPTLATFAASDGYPFFFRRYAPAGEAKARVIFLHGIQSHGTWYGRSCAAIAGAGYEVFFLDRRGCGQNMKARADLPSFRRALDDVANFIGHLPDDGKPRLLGAISWGGKLGAALPYRHPGLIDGLALLCPGIVPKIRPPFATRARIALARVFRPGKLFPIPLNDPALFTTSPAWRAFIQDDHLSLHHATARMLFNSFALDIYLRRSAKAVEIPVLLQLAEHDAIIDNAGVRKYVESFPSQDKEVIEYPGAHHTLEFERDGHPFAADLVKWLDRCSGRGRNGPKASATDNRVRR